MIFNLICFAEHKFKRLIKMHYFKEACSDLP